ncbi:MarR family transcriptional regulator [Sphingobium cupriresistens LL01]|uniref:MarR family transcriptional regulator n=2 Tax=Sphingobium cupriresistens TaxID=1132417 RepID=A0A0J8AE12_9SPHN|nr:MarR family transcriptional regulator [Sphingobium cupriresistens LL01]
MQRSIYRWVWIYWKARARALVLIGVIRDCNVIGLWILLFTQEKIMEKGSPSAGSSSADDLADVATHYLKLRRKRELAFPNLFFDPSWDILIDLYAAAGTGHQVSVTSACIASRAPTSTALRHIDRMIDLGLIARRNDPQDGRRIHLQLTDAGNDLIETFICGLARLAQRRPAICDCAASSVEDMRGG